MRSWFLLATLLICGCVSDFAIEETQQELANPEYSIESELAYTSEASLTESQTYEKLKTGEVEVDTAGFSWDYEDREACYNNGTYGLRARSTEEINFRCQPREGEGTIRCEIREKGTGMTTIFSIDCKNDSSNAITLDPVQDTEILFRCYPDYKQGNPGEYVETSAPITSACGVSLSRINEMKRYSSEEVKIGCESFISAVCRNRIYQSGDTSNCEYWHAPEEFKLSFCLEEFAARSKDIEYCHQIDSELYKNRCYKTVAVGTADPDICLQTTTDTYCGSCFGAMALYSEDAICGKVPQRCMDARLGLQRSYIELCGE
ncbi:hypothetical protein ACFLQI_01635 [Candidatus Undinarchaeota archaeon]